MAAPIKAGYGGNLPYPYDVKAKLTQTSLKQRIDTVLQYVNLERKYYYLNYELGREELNSQKWKTYIFLRKVVLEYRKGRQDELLSVLAFLKVSKNKTWLAKKLLDSSTKAGEEEKWGSGQHEWLERCLIIDVIKRSAGMVEGVQSETEMGCVFEDFDWLYIQAKLRMPTKYIFLKNDENTIQTGHPGAVKPDLTKKGFATQGSYHFHKSLEEAFKESTTIGGYLKRIQNIFREAVFSGKKHIQPAEQVRYIVDGSPTTDEKAINDFRKRKLRKEGYEPFTEEMLRLIDCSTECGGKEIEDDVESIASESSDEDTESYSTESEVHEKDLLDELLAFDELEISENSE